MRFVEVDKGGQAGEEQEITFLYQIAPGTAHRSYGLNVARLARVPKPVLDLAAVKSREMEEQVRAKRVAGLARMVEGLVTGVGGGGGDVEGKREADLLEQLIVGIEEL